MPWTRISEALGLNRGGGTRAALDSLLTAVGLGERKGRHSAAFTMAVIALCAKMAKADGVVVKVEADTFERLFNVPHDEIANVRRLFDLAKADVAGYEAYADKIADLLADDPPILRDILETLFHIAAADGILHDGEAHFLQDVARRFSIPPHEFAAIRALFVKDPASPYTVLGLPPDASDAEIRARHRALVLEHHPDRLVGHGVPADFVAIAERKLAAINAAYDAIRKERGQ
jgi:DnaJ like chaperone protein